MELRFGYLCFFNDNVANTDEQNDAEDAADDDESDGPALQAVWRRSGSKTRLAGQGAAEGGERASVWNGSKTTKKEKGTQKGKNEKEKMTK